MAKDIKVDGPGGLPLPTAQKKTTIKRTVSFTGPDAEAQAAKYQEAQKGMRQANSQILRQNIQQRNQQVTQQKQTDATKSAQQTVAAESSTAVTANVLTTTGASETLKLLKTITLPSPSQTKPDATLAKAILSKLGSGMEAMNIAADSSSMLSLMQQLSNAGLPVQEMSNLQIMMLLLEIHHEDKKLLQQLTTFTHLADIAQKKLQEKKVETSQIFEKLDLLMGSFQGSIKLAETTHKGATEIGDGMLEMRKGIIEGRASENAAREADRRNAAEASGRRPGTDQALSGMRATPTPEAPRPTADGSPPPAAPEITGAGPLSALLSLPSTATPTAMARLNTSISEETARIRELQNRTPPTPEIRNEITQARGRLAVLLQRKADYLSVNPRAAPPSEGESNRTAMRENLNALQQECGTVGRREIEERIAAIRGEELPSAPTPPATEDQPRATLRSSVASARAQAQTQLTEARVEHERLAAQAPPPDPVNAGPLTASAMGATLPTTVPSVSDWAATPPAAAPPASGSTPPPSEAERRGTAIFARVQPLLDEQRRILNNPSATPEQKAQAHARIERLLGRAADACRLAGAEPPDGLQAARTENTDAMGRLIGGTGLLAVQEDSLAARERELAAIRPAPNAERLAAMQTAHRTERAHITGSREAGQLARATESSLAEVRQAEYALELYRLRTNPGVHMSPMAMEATAMARAQVYTFERYGGPNSRGLQAATQERDRYRREHRDSTTTNDPRLATLEDRVARLSAARDQERESLSSARQIAGTYNPSTLEFSGGLFTEIETLVTQTRLTREQADHAVATMLGATASYVATLNNPNSTSIDQTRANIGLERATLDTRILIESAQLRHGDRSEAVVNAQAQLMRSRQNTRDALPDLMAEQERTSRTAASSSSNLQMFDAAHPEVAALTSPPSDPAALRLYTERAELVRTNATAQVASARATQAVENNERETGDYDSALAQMRVLRETKNVTSAGPTDDELIAQAARFTTLIAAERAADQARINLAGRRVLADMNPSDVPPEERTNNRTAMATDSAELRRLVGVANGHRRDVQLEDNAMRRRMEGWRAPPASALPATPPVPSEHASDPIAFYDRQIIEAELAQRLEGEIAGRARPGPVPDGLFSTDAGENARLAQEVLEGRRDPPAIPTSGDSSGARAQWIEQATRAAGRARADRRVAELNASIGPLMEAGRALYATSGEPPSAESTAAMWTSVSSGEDQRAWAALAPATPAPGTPTPATPPPRLPPHDWPPTSADLESPNADVRRIAGSYLTRRASAEDRIFQARLASLGPNAPATLRSNYEATRRDATTARTEIDRLVGLLNASPPPAEAQRTELTQQLRTQQQALRTAQRKIDLTLGREQRRPWDPPVEPLRPNTKEFERANTLPKMPYGWGWLTGALGMIGGLSGLISQLDQKFGSYRKEVSDISSELEQRAEQFAAQAKAELQGAASRIPADSRRMFDLLRELSEGVAKGR